MTWQQWVLVIWYSIVALSNVLCIGVERKPLTPGVAAFNIVILGILTFLVVSI